MLSRRSASTGMPLLPTPVSGRSSRTSRAAGQSPARAATTERASAPGGEICVCDLTPAFEQSGSTISHHLKTLREAGLVDAERRASWVYYRARPGLMRQLATLLTPDE